jgi:DNA polymerase III sliding clamp (beta) subunit (PCNA family)
MATKEQINALTKLTKANAALPILSNVKFETGKISATNLDMAIIIEDEDVTQNGYVLGPKLKKSGLATIQKHWGLVDNTEHKPEDWPEIKPNEATQSVNEATISGMLDALTTVSKDDSRPVLTGIELANSTATSTDGYRLITRNTGHSLNMIIPSAAVEIIKTTKLMHNWMIGYDKEQVTFKNGKFTLVARLIDGTYPDWRKLAPAKAARRVTVKAALLYEALDLIEGGNIRLDQNGGVYVQAGDRDDSKRSLIAVMKPDTDIELNINYMHIVMPLKGTSSDQVLLNDSYVRDAVGKSEYAEFSFNGALEPVVVQGVSR